MQCKLVTALPAGERWTFEIKFDGYRCIAVKRGRESPWIRNVNLHFGFCNTVCSSRFLSIFTPSIYLTEMNSS